MATFLVAGASRGIGLSLVSEILAENAANKVIAGVRNTDNKALNAIASSHSKRVTVLKLDVDNIDSVQEAADKITQQFPEGIDYLFHNAGVSGSESYTGIVSTFNTNAVGALRVVDTFVPLLKKGSKKTILFVSSVAGNYAAQPAFSEMTKLIGQRMYGYRLSKAALNFLTDILARDLAADGIKVVATHPGYVDTDMSRGVIGGQKDNVEALSHGMISPQDSAKVLLEFGIKVTSEDSGKFFDVNGKKVSNLPV